ncbi:MAG: hypothetical protein ACRDD7_06355 [Peptostreptococcaceae bacterium]
MNDTFTIEIKPIELCSYCLGSGKQKAMQSAINGNVSVRYIDTDVKCKYCNGSGVKNKNEDTI